MNDIATQQGANLPATSADLLKGLTNQRDTAQSVNTGGMPILKMNQEGIWAYGQENIEVEQGSQWVIDPYSLQHGYVAWGDGQLLGEVMHPSHEPLPNKNDLTDYGVEWTLQQTFQMRCIGGSEDIGLICINKGNSKGHAQMMKDFINELIVQAQSGSDAVYPIVELDHDSYTNKTYKRTIYTPVLNIVDWWTAAQLEAFQVALEEGTDMAEDEGPDAPPFEEDKPKAEAEAKPTKTARRRRRRTAA